MHLFYGSQKIVDKQNYGGECWVEKILVFRARNSGLANAIKDIESGEIAEDL